MFTHFAVLISSPCAVAVNHIHIYLSLPLCELLPHGDDIAVAANSVGGTVMKKE